MLRENAGELEDRLAVLAAETLAAALPELLAGALTPVPQRESLATHAPKIAKADAPLDCPITAMGGARDSSTPLDELAAWGEQTRGRFATHVFPGDHFFLHSARQLLPWTIAQELLVGPYPDAGSLSMLSVL